MVFQASLALQCSLQYKFLSFLPKQSLVAAFQLSLTHIQHTLHRKLREIFAIKQTSIVKDYKGRQKPKAHSCTYT